MSAMKIWVKIIIPVDPAAEKIEEAALKINLLVDSMVPYILQYKTRGKNILGVYIVGTSLHNEAEDDE